MMTRLQIAAAVVVGYWLGRGHRKKLGLLLAAAGAGRLAGGPPGNGGPGLETAANLARIRRAQ